MFVESEHIRNITIPFIKEKAIWICDDKYRNMMKAPESSVMNQLEKLMNIILNLKVDNLSEEEKLKVLSFTMLCNSELPEILENRKYFKFTCDKNKYKTTDENRLSILKKIRDTYQEKIDDLLGVIESEKTEKHIYDEAITLFFNHTPPTDFNMQEYENRVIDSLKKNMKIVELMKLKTNKSQKSKFPEKLKNELVGNCRFVMPEKLRKYKDADTFKYSVRGLPDIYNNSLIRSFLQFKNIIIADLNYTSNKDLVQQMVKYEMIDKIDKQTFVPGDIICDAQNMIKSGDIDISVFEQLVSFLNVKQNKEKRMILI